MISSLTNLLKISSVQKLRATLTSKQKKDGQSEVNKVIEKEIQIQHNKDQISLLNNKEI